MSRQVCTTSSLLQQESLDLVNPRLVHLSAIYINFHFLLLWRSVTVFGCLKTPGVNTWPWDQGKASTLPRQAGPVIISDCAGCYLVPKKKGSAIGFYVSSWFLMRSWTCPMYPDATLGMWRRGDVTLPCISGIRPFVPVRWIHQDQLAASSSPPSF